MTVEKWIAAVLRSTPLRGAREASRKALMIVLWQNRDVLKRLKDR